MGEVTCNVCKNTSCCSLSIKHDKYCSAGFDIKKTIKDLERWKEILLNPETQEPPIKGRDVIIWCSDGNTYNAFRCACHNDECVEWRDSVIGDYLIIDKVLYWEYVDNQ